MGSASGWCEWVVQIGSASGQCKCSGQQGRYRGVHASGHGVSGSMLAGSRMPVPTMLSSWSGRCDGLFPEAASSLVAGEVQADADTGSSEPVAPEAGGRSACVVVHAVGGLAEQDAVRGDQTDRPIGLQSLDELRTLRVHDAVDRDRLGRRLHAVNALGRRDMEAGPIQSEYRRRLGVGRGGPLLHRSEGKPAPARARKPHASCRRPGRGPASVQPLRSCH